MTTGEDVQSRNVILAMGAYFNISGVLTPVTSRDMDLKLTSQTIAYIRVSAEEAEVELYQQKEKFKILCRRGFQRCLPW